MGIPEERYSRITAKNQREICLLRGFPCAWGKCAFCDYIEDNGRDREAMEALNRQVLAKVMGDMGALEIINSGSCFELPEATLDGIAALVHNKNIQQLFFEAHWIQRGSRSHPFPLSSGTFPLPSILTPSHHDRANHSSHDTQHPCHEIISYL